MPAQKRASDNLKVEEEEEEDSQQQLQQQQQQQHQSRKEEDDDDEGGVGDEGDGMYRYLKSHWRKKREREKITSFLLLCSADSDGSPSHSAGKDDEYDLFLFLFCDLLVCESLRSSLAAGLAASVAAAAPLFVCVVDLAASLDVSISCFLQYLRSPDRLQISDLRKWKPGSFAAYEERRTIPIDEVGGLEH
ncbi:hypothetical protein ACLOJK_039299 [Asimina triloba]